MQSSPCTIETFTASDGYTFSYRHFPAQGRARGQVVAIHGIQSHGGWYEASAAHLAHSGWEVLFLDRRGSGLNQAARGDTPSYRRLLADIDEFILARCERPPFVMAISWGAKLGVALEHLSPGMTAGLILVTPGICPRIRPVLSERLKIAVARLVWPWWRFPIPLDDPALFTATPHWQEFIRNDPLALRKATARFLVASVFLDRLLRRSPREVCVPVLLLLGRRDRIIDNEKTRAYLERFATSDRQVLEYKDGHHTLEFEPDPTPIFRDIERWLEVRQGLLG